MYRPQHFDESRLPVLHALMRRHPLAAIVASTPAGLEANHVPLVLDSERGAYGLLRGHVARANPVWQSAAAGSEVLAIFQGADHYISPNWYPAKAEHGKVVPTWNYAVVHARGAIEWIHDRDWLRDLVEATTALHERGEPRPWSVADAPAEFVERQLEAIVGFEISICRIEGKWKLSQNRGAADRAGVLAALSQQDCAAAREMAETMQRPDAAPER